MTKNTHRIFIFLGIVCIIFALSLTAYNLHSEIRAKHDSERIIDEFNMPKNKRMPEDDSIKATVPFYQYESNYEMPTIVIEGVRYIGVLSIPELGLELPVASEWTYPQLKKTACRYSGSAYSRDMVICAHNYSTHFGRISRLSEGALVTFTDVDGNAFRYEVCDIEILYPNQTKEMTSYDEGLTLFTCTLGRRTRVAVRTVPIGN